MTSDLPDVCIIVDTIEVLDIAVRVKVTPKQTIFKLFHFNIPGGIG